MRKAVLSILVVMLVPYISISQEVISGKSSIKKYTLEPKYERDLPPNLYVDLSFEDDNGNGIIESNENANLKLTITNKGKGKAQGLNVTISDNISDNNFTIGDNKKIYFLNPDESTEVIIPINAGFKVKSCQVYNIWSYLMQTEVKNWVIVSIVENGEELGKVLWGICVTDPRGSFDTGNYICNSC